MVRRRDGLTAISDYSARIPSLREAEPEEVIIVAERYWREILADEWRLALGEPGGSGARQKGRIRGGIQNG
jgi:hypothetical protein